MLKIRVIPILTFNGFALVKTRQFDQPRMVGNPVQAARIFNSRNVDELIFLDIFATRQGRNINYPLVKEVIKECFMPIGIGGGIRTLEDIDKLLHIGADKVILKTVLLENAAFVQEAVNYYGSQCISAAVDVKQDSEGQYWIYYQNKQSTITLEEFIHQLHTLNVGELIVNSVNNDGMMDGFDITLINYIAQISTLPIVAVGGGGTLEHYRTLFTETNCDAVGSGSIYYFTQYTSQDIREEIRSVGKAVRGMKD